MLQLGLNPSNGSSRAKRSDAADAEGHDGFFKATISYEEELSRPNAEGVQWLDMQIAPKACCGGTPNNPIKRPYGGAGSNSASEFREALVASVIPLDMRALRAIKASPLAIDLYIWLCHKSDRAQRTGKGRFVAWSNLMEQFGTHMPDPKDFGKRARGALRKVQAIYPQLRLGSLRGGITIAANSRQAIDPREPLIASDPPGHKPR